MARNDVACWLVGLCLFAMSMMASAGEIVPVSACSAPMQSLSSAAQIMIDETGQQTPDAVMRLPTANFQDVVAGRQLAYGKGVSWARVDLHNANDATCHRWLLAGPARLRNVRVYVKQTGEWHIMRGGTAYPLREWAVPRRQPVFPLALAPGTTTHVLIRVAKSNDLQSLTPQLWAPSHYRQVTAHRDVINGLMYGATFLLFLASLTLAWIYRRPALCLMALAVAFFASYVAAQSNYFFVYLWPGSPELNLWARFFLTGMKYAMGYGYLCVTVRIHKLGRWWSCLFAVIVVSYVLLGALGSVVDRPWQGPIVLLSLDAASRWLLALAVVLGFRRGTLRGWYAPLLVGLLCIHNIWIYGHFFGLLQPPFLGSNLYEPAVFVVDLLLLGTLFNQVRKGRRRELRAHADLDRQRATENRRLEQTVTSRTQALADALQSRRMLLGSISHDLRSPLAAMLDSTRLWRAGDTRRDYPRLIERHADRQMELIDELLEFSGTELAATECMPVPGYLYSFLDDVAETTELATERHGTRLHRHFAAGLPAVARADFRSLRRVLTNLLGNADKYVRQGRIDFIVDRLATGNEDMARLHFIVDDNGAGLSAAQRKNLLQPFARGDNVGDIAGSGLGLAIVTTLLKRMGSHLQVDTSPSGGSRFDFELTLPLATESELEPLLEDGGSIDVDGTNYTVLVVDDEPRQREITCDLLGGYGFDAHAAADGQVALDLLQGQHVDLILTDQFMPGMGGWQLLQAVRSREPDLPALLYSAVPPLCPDGMDDVPGFDACLLKPADGAALLRLIMAQLDRPAAA